MRMPDVSVVLASSKRYMDLVQSKATNHNCVCENFGYRKSNLAIHGTAINVSRLLEESVAEWETYEPDDTVDTEYGPVSREYVNAGVQVLSFLEDH